jgi:hypothetical protein
MWVVSIVEWQFRVDLFGLKIEGNKTKPRARGFVYFMLFINDANAAKNKAIASSHLRCALNFFIN